MLALMPSSMSARFLAALTRALFWPARPGRATPSNTHLGGIKSPRSSGLLTCLRGAATFLLASTFLTRAGDREDLWGPCINTRGRIGNTIPADLKISIHGDGSYGGGPGFHVIAPTDRKPWTHDIYASSKALALVTRRSLHKGAGLPYAGYIAGGDGLDFRSDLGTLNLSNVPTVMVELGNMKDSEDVARMTSAQGRRAYAAALARAAVDYLS